MLTHTTLTRSVGALAALVLVASACGSDDTPAAAPATAAVTTMDPDMEMDDDDHAEDEADDHAGGFSFGEPADAADATRVIEIATNDDFTFDPAALTVEAGEIVTFRVENVGFLDHDFTLGDEETQIDHEAEMAEMAEGGAMMDMPDESNAFSLAAGETKELTWHFTEAGDILYGCHIPGHYAAGMKGTLSIGA